MLRIKASGQQPAGNARRDSHAGPFRCDNPAKAGDASLGGMAMSTFQSFKHELVHVAALSKDALHIYVGLAVFLLVVAVHRRGLRSGLAPLAVFVVALIGELLDLRDEMRHHEALKWGASLHDIANTCFWPLLLWLLGRYTRIVK